MVEGKKINAIIAVTIALALTFSMALVIFGNSAAVSAISYNEPSYATEIFGRDIISVEILADDNDWQEMLDNARNEQYIMADVIINGTKFQNVGIRPKGNSSLTQVASSESDRYSFRLQFDEYIKDQTCFGLSSMVVNNMLGDSTYMKEYVSYELMQEAGVDCPYFGYADIKVNGENWGLYLAVEMYNESYEQRVYGDTSGMLYNVKSMDIGEGNAGEGNFPNMPNREDGRVGQPGGNFGGPPGQNGNTRPAPDGRTEPPANTNARPSESAQDSQVDGVTKATPNLSDPVNDTTNEGDTGGVPDGNRPAGGMGFPGGQGGHGSNGGTLQYTDDSSESYSAIFNNVVGKGSESDYQRLIEALKALSEDKDLEEYFDVDQILRYLAAHTIVVNLDSYSSSMAQNYYIYEKKGKITILPWDYNLSWGGFQSGGASSVVNFPIDTPVSGVEMSERPLLEKLFANSEYFQRYHEYLRQLINGYFADGKFEAKINELDAIIGEYVKNDATAFSTYEQYKTAQTAFIELGNFRAESVEGQLDGTVPSTTTEQSANQNKLISAGSLNLSSLGSMMGGRGDRGGQIPQGVPNNNQNTLEGEDRSAPVRQAMAQVVQPQTLDTDYLILLGALAIGLIIAIVFAARIRKSY